MSLASKIAVILLILFPLSTFPGSRNLYGQESGYKFFKNYSYKEYGHHAQNWGIARAQNGIIYVANQAGVLEYDGETWRVIYKDIPNYTVRSLDIDAGGTVYIGGKDEIGYLQADEKGSLKYVSLVDKLDDTHKNFSTAWRTHATKEGIYFRTSTYLFRWNRKQKKIKTWQASSRLNASFLYRGRLLIHEKGIGLKHIVNDRLKLIKGGEQLANEIIYLAVPYDTNPGKEKLLIGTRSNGFFLYDGDTFAPFPTDADDYLKKNKASHGARLSGGDFALTTRSGGLIIMDPHGKIKYIFDKRAGLQDENVKYVFEDTRGNLWLALNNGITRLENNSPFFLYDDRTRLPGIIYSLVRHRGDLYAGTSRGLFVLRPQAGDFSAVAGIPGNCWSLLSRDQSLLAATTAGIFQVDSEPGLTRKILDVKCYSLYSCAAHPGLIRCGTSSGVVTLTRRKNRWIKEPLPGTGSRDIESIAEDKNGNLWFATSTGSVLKADFHTRRVAPVVTPYSAAKATNEARVYYAVRAAGHVIFATANGIFRIDENNETLIPDFTLGKRFAGGRKDSKPVFRIAEDNNRHIWFHSESRNFLAIPGPDGAVKLEYKPFLRQPEAQVNVIYPDPDGKNIWFGSIEGLTRYDTSVKKNYRQHYPVLIRKVQVNDRLIFAGSTKRTSREAVTPLPTIDYTERNVLFEYAAPFFEDETATQYQSVLDGYDKAWSTWSKETKRSYTNLDTGRYTFRVRAKNVYQHVSSEGIYRFKVQPPWYKTWWAILIYVILSVLLMNLIVKWQSGKLEREKQKLENIIKERTREIKEKNQKLEQQTLQLRDQSEKLKEMDKVKSRFFANISHEFRTPLTLIMSPLEQMLSDSPEKDRATTLKVMLRNSRRLLTLINQLLDLSRFDSGKMKLQVSNRNIVPFLKGVLSSFHILADKNELTLEFQTEKEEIPVYFDARRLEEAVNNLLINAIKFTPAGGKITVAVSIDRKSEPGELVQAVEKSPIPREFIIISVQDSGAGIPKEELAHIFDRFYQSEGHKEKALKGTGIGLALTKEAVLLHQGKIDVHSREGKGTEFVIQLPMGAKHLQQEEIVTAAESAPGSAQVRQTPPEYFDDMEEEEETADAEPAAGQETGQENGAQEKNVILVVEDHPDMRRHIKTALTPFYTVLEARDGQEGIEKAKANIPDLIISDIMMPEVDGNQLCRELKKDIKTSHVPIVLLTAKASEGNIIEGLETGADDYITKPFNTKILLTRIKNLIELRSHLQQKIQKQMLLQPAEIAVSSMDREFIEELQAVIQKNLSDPEFHVEELSKKLYMDRTTVYRKVKALTGESPTQYIRSYRLSRAAQLLRDGFGTVSQVSLEVGISNVAYFAKCFKEKYEQLPSEYLSSEAR